MAVVPQSSVSLPTSISQDGQTWVEVECGRAFNGNKDSQHQGKTLFSRSRSASTCGSCRRSGTPTCRCVRPSSCTNGPALMGGWSRPFKGDLLISKTKGPSLEALWGEGVFDAPRVLNLRACAGPVVGRGPRGRTMPQDPRPPTPSTSKPTSTRSLAGAAWCTARAGATRALRQQSVAVLPAGLGHQVRRKDPPRGRVPICNNALRRRRDVKLSSSS